MDERETQALMDDVASVMKSLVAKATAPLIARIAQLEGRLDNMPAPKDGKDADIEPWLVRAGEMIFPKVRAVEEKLDAMPAQEPLLARIAELETKLASLPVPRDGKDGRDGVDGKDGVDGERGEKGADGKDGVDGAPGKDGIHGKDGAAGLDGAAGRDGIDGKDGADGKEGPQGRPGEAGKDGRDGLDAVEFLRGSGGHLVVTMSNGSTRDLGEIDGKDGRDGAAGEKGADGKDGLDGVGFDDMSCEVREDGVYLVWEKGDVAKEARLPIPMDRGVWKEGQTYKAGDGVTWGGSFWFAQAETAEKPDTGKGWRQAVKKGRDGKDFTPPEKKKV